MAPPMFIGAALCVTARTSERDELLDIIIDELEEKYK